MAPGPGKGSDGRWGHTLGAAERGLEPKHGRNEATRQPGRSLRALPLHPGRIQRFTPRRTAKQRCSRHTVLKPIAAAICCMLRCSSPTPRQQSTSWSVTLRHTNRTEVKETRAGPSSIPLFSQGPMSGNPCLETQTTRNFLVVQESV